MKKLLLLSAIAAAAFSASAQESFSDVISTTYEGKEVSNGATLVSTHYDDNAWQYGIEFTMKPKADVPVKIYYGAGYGAYPTADQLATGEYGSPQLCYSVTDPTNSLYNCVGFPIVLEPNRNVTLTSLSESEVEWQFHVLVDEGPDIKDGFYMLEFEVEADGAKYEDSFIVYLAIGPTATGVEGIEISDEATPVEFYNLNGVRVNTPARGEVVIARQGSKVSKTIIR